MTNQNVGRDELAALLGASHASDMVTAAGTSSSDINKKSSTTGATATTKHYTKGGEDNVDISKMDRAQAAALVARKFAAGSSGTSSEVGGGAIVRHRATGKRKRMLQHHLLASDLLEQQQQLQQQQDVIQDKEDLKLYEKGAEDDDDEEGDEFIKVDTRKKNEAKVLTKKSSDSGRRHRRGSSSSSSSSDSESSNSSSDNSTSQRRNSRRRNRRSRSNSSSSSEDEADVRRRRARERKALQDKQNDNKETVVSSSSINHDEIGTKELKKYEEEIVRKDVKMQPSDDMSVDDESLAKEEVKETKPQKETKRGRSRANSSSSSGSEDSSSASSSSDSSSSSSSDESDDHKSTLPTSISKPLFVPKSKRGTVAEIELQQQKHDNAEKVRVQQAEKRAIQSRALVAEAVSASGKNGTTNEGIGGEDEFDTGEAGGEFIVVPDDTDPTEEDSPELVMAERDAWEVRELIRILRDVDEALVQEKEKKELERRRGLSDNERLMEDKRSGRYRAPGESRRQQRADGDNKSYLQKFHHRGAFYMDEDTLDQAGADDIRHKAAEYSKASTGSDKVDKSALPEVMQVKNFGLAGYSTKYKGLGKEDTTDKQLDFLPIRGHKKKGGRSGETERRERY